MTVTRLALTLALGAFVANLYLKSRHRAYTLTTRPADDGAAPWREASPPDLLTPSGTDADNAAIAQQSRSMTDGDSPNEAERLQAQGLAQTPASGLGSDVLAPTVLGESDETDAVSGIKPGLPDFTCGA